MANTTIQVTTETRDHLAELAAERGTTIGALVAAFSASQLTEQELAERQQAGREAMRQRLPDPPSDEDLAGSAGALERFYAIAADQLLRDRDAAA
jgi:predicted acylesterase/phospholipase RssA